MAIALALAWAPRCRPAALAKRAPSRLHAFASCPESSATRGGHFVQTKGAPSPAWRRWPSRPSRAQPADATTAPEASSQAQGGGAEPTRRRTTRRRASTSPTSSRPTARRSSRSPAHAVRGRGDGAARRGSSGSLELSRSGGELLLHGQRLLVISERGPDRGEPVAARRLAASRRSTTPAQTDITEVDVRDPAAHEGRAHDDRRRPVRQRPPERRDRARRDLLGAARDRDADARGRASGWVPRSRFASRDLRAPSHRAKIVACRAVRRPPAFSGLGMLSILTIDLDKGLWEVDADAVMADAQTVYGSTGHLYVATQRWIDPDTAAPSCRRRVDGDPPLRRRATPTARPTRPAARSRATCSTSSRCPSTAATCASPRPPSRCGGRARSRAEPELRDRAAPRRARRSPPSGGSPGSARASGSTRCASSATSATS